MVCRKLPFRFGYRSVRKRISRWLVNEEPSTPNDKVYPQLPFLIRAKPYRIKNSMDKSLAGQLNGLTFNVTDLFRDERVLLNYNKATEIRPYVELLIIEAMRHGDKHRPTMALANYWLREKNLIHKLFKVFVPRYLNYPSSFTALHMMGQNYKLNIRENHEIQRRAFVARDEVILELRGNCLPPIVRPKVNRSGLLTNILIDGARESQRKEAKVITSNAPSNE